MNQIIENRYYSTFEIAKICQVAPSSVVRWIHEGKLPAATTAGGHHRVRCEDLEMFLESLGMATATVGKEKVKKQTKKDTPSILIVDDEEAIRKIMRMQIEKDFPQFQVEEAWDGFRAGWIAHALEPDLIILDIMLPGMDGYEVCKFLRENPALQSTKIIVITALGEQARTRMLSIGADDFLAKPFQWQDMKQKITALLGQGGAKNSHDLAS